MGIRGLESLGATPDPPEEVRILAQLFLLDMDYDSAYEHAIGFLENHDANVRSDVLLEAAKAIREAANEGRITYIRDVEDLLNQWSTNEID